jgi:hypothetical protein
MLPLAFTGIAEKVPDGAIEFHDFYMKMAWVPNLRQQSDKLALLAVSNFCGSHFEA